MHKLFTTLGAILAIILVFVLLLTPAYTDDSAVFGVFKNESGTVESTVENTELNAVTEPELFEPATEETTSPHKHFFEIVVIEPTCATDGIVNYQCAYGEQYTEITSPALGHDYEKQIIVPNCLYNGYTIYTCIICGHTYTGDYTQPNNEHHWNDWVMTVTATPVNDGVKYRVCSICQKEEYTPYSVSWCSNYAVCIPTAGIHAGYTVSDFTQDAVDKYDMVYCYPSTEHDPFIIGHNSRSIASIYDVRVGDYIYINWNGTIRTYRVIVSEFALQTNNRQDIIGQTTGASIWDTFKAETLHMYTCYGKIENHRWMVLAERIQ